MDFLFEFFDIYMNEKAITCHDCYGFKWKKHKYLSNFDYFSLQSDTLFGWLDCDYTHKHRLQEKKWHEMKLWNVKILSMHFNAC
jgi:hypothetical protein